MGGDPEKKEMTDDEMEKFDEKRGEAMSSFSEGEWEAAIALFTEAIKLNPNSAAMFADNAGAYKFRGRAHRLLGNFTQAAADLATACKIDFDEQADEWLKEVQPNAEKLAEHQRKKDRKEAEKALNEKKERIRKAKEAQRRLPRKLPRTRRMTWETWVEWEVLEDFSTTRRWWPRSPIRRWRPPSRTSPPTR